MTTPPLIRKFLPEEWRIYRDLRLRSLADSPAAFGRTLAEEQARSDAFWSERISTAAESPHDLPLWAQASSEGIGLAWGRRDSPDSDTTALYQMWVSAEHRRLGVGRQLVDTVAAWAKNGGARWLALEVIAENSAAMRLDLRAGFAPYDKGAYPRPDSQLTVQPLRMDLQQRSR